MKLIVALTVMCVAYATAQEVAEETGDDEPWTWKTYVKDHLTIWGIQVVKIYELCDKCQAETKVDTSLFAKMAVRDFPEDQNLKCFWACLAGKLNVIMGKKDPDYLNANALADKLNPTQLGMATKCLEYYMKPAYGDECNQVYTSHKCYMWTMDKVHACEAAKEAADVPPPVDDDPTPEEDVEDSGAEITAAL